MFGALLYLRLTSLRNLLQSRLRRLRQPKYLLGAIVGGAYFYFVFFRRARLGGPHGAGAGALGAFPADLLPTVASLGAVLLLVVFALGWIVPDDRAGLAFTEAEIAFLFPAPVTRRTLIHYKLLGSQFAIFFTALVFTLLSNRWSFLGGNAVTHAIGWWLILAAINLHWIGASFVITRLLDRGVTSLRRRLAVFGVLALAVALVLAWAGRDLRAPRLEDMASFRTFADYLSILLGSGPLPWLLLPARLVLGPFLAPNAAAFLLALGPALLVLAVHYVWVLRTEVSFEEASIAKAEKRAAKVAALREGNWRAARGTLKARRAPFRLGATGRPEVAFLWKNLLSTYEYFRPRTAVVAAAAIAGGCTWLAAHPVYRFALPVVMALALMAALYILLLGPQLARQDLRGDLPNADILKTYPLPGWQVALGELLAPTAILTALLWLTLLALALTFRPHRLDWLTPGLRTELALCLGAVTPVVCALQLFVPNAATLLFPAWLHAGRQRGERGIEVMGQRLIFLVGQLLVMVLALLPAALGAALLVFATQWLIGLPAALVLATLAVIVILAAEVGAGLWWLGRRFEQFDLSAELRP